MLTHGQHQAITYRSARIEDAPDIAHLHRDEIDFGFLSTLRPGFLTVLYRAILRSNCASCIVAECQGRLIGFVAVTTDMEKMYKVVFHRSRMRLFLHLLPSLVSVRVIRYCWQTFRYPNRKPPMDLPAAELLSIAVSHCFIGQGIGKRLVNSALDRLWEIQVPAVRVAVLATVPANRFYQALGWVLAGTMEHHGRRLNLYVQERPKGSMA